MIKNQPFVKEYNIPNAEVTLFSKGPSAQDDISPPTKQETSGREDIFYVHVESYSINRSKKLLEKEDTFFIHKILKRSCFKSAIVYFFCCVGFEYS
ncbi:hypothetical protein AAHA92_15940 [Salvia divinorum]|uniref:Uncharacterized protein n=1 Tax=Salvia divinorum TaxID=28513 RepID=A0ABD1GUE7_SALDI